MQRIKRVGLDILYDDTLKQNTAPQSINWSFLVSFCFVLLFAAQLCPQIYLIFSPKVNEMDCLRLIVYTGDVWQNQAKAHVCNEAIDVSLTGFKLATHLFQAKDLRSQPTHNFYFFTDLLWNIDPVEKQQMFIALYLPCALCCPSNQRTGLQDPIGQVWKVRSTHWIPRQFNQLKLTFAWK